MLDNPFVWRIKYMVLKKNIIKPSDMQDCICYMLSKFLIPRLYVIPMRGYVTFQSISVYHYKNNALIDISTMQELRLGWFNMVAKGWAAMLRVEVSLVLTGNSKTKFLLVQLWMAY